MKKKDVFVTRLLTVMIAVVLLSSIASFSAIPEAKAKYTVGLDQEVNALPMGYAWVTSYNSSGGFDDVIFLSFGHYYGYRTELSAYIGAVVDTYNTNYLINWSPNIVGDTLRVCGVRVAYKLSLGGGTYETGFHYFHIPGAALLPRDSSVEWGYAGGGCIYLKSGTPSVIFNINLNIPNESRIDYLRVYYYREAQVFLPMIKR